MSLRKKFTIAFSQELAAASTVRKQDALDALIKIIDSEIIIEDESVEADQLVQDIFDLFISYAEQRSIDHDKQLTIRSNSVPQHAMQEIELLGFDVLR